jgi:RNA polymerase sigma factor (sigma-70 family)
MHESHEIISTKLPFIRRVANFHLGRHYRDWVDDITQDVVLKLVNRSGSHQLSITDAWLYSVTKNHCFDFMAKKCNSIPLRIPIEFLENSLMADYEIDESDVKLVRLALQNLNSRDRKLLVGKYFLGFTGSELAEISTIPEKNIGVYVQRAKQQLKIEFRKLARLNC